MAHDEGFRRGITEEPGYDGSGLTADETKQRKAMRLLEANNRLELYPATLLRYRDILQHFSWSNAPITKIQMDLNDTLHDHAELRAGFVPFLDASLRTDGERARAEGVLCELIGIPCTMKRNEEMISMTEWAFFESVKARTGRFDEVNEMVHTPLAQWMLPGGREEAYERTRELLREDNGGDKYEDLRQRLEVVKQEWKPKSDSVGGARM